MRRDHLPKPVEARWSILLEDGSRIRRGTRGELVRVLSIRDSARSKAGVVEWEDGPRTLVSPTDVREVRA